jgi:hypothetical protein
MKKISRVDSMKTNYKRHIFRHNKQVEQMDVNKVEAVDQTDVNQVEQMDVNQAEAMEQIELYQGKYL